ncbi:unnamed protein product [Merluccius merluccius]
MRRFERSLLYDVQHFAATRLPASGPGEPLTAPSRDQYQYQYRDQYRAHPVPELTWSHARGREPRLPSASAGPSRVVGRIPWRLDSGAGSPGADHRPDTVWTLLARTGGSTSGPRAPGSGPPAPGSGPPAPGVTTGLHQQGAPARRLDAFLFILTFLNQE